LIFTYITKNLFIYRAGLALAGYGDCNVDVKSPNVHAFLNPSNVARYESFVRELFMGVEVPNLHTSSKAFHDHMMASVIMYHNDVASEIGDHHILVKAVRDTAAMCNITTSTLDDWANSIRQKFQLDNALARTTL
jgi:hypothetical protein